MNPLHLLWIVPASASLGFMLAGLLHAGRDPKNDDYIEHIGEKKGEQDSDEE